MDSIRWLRAHPQAPDYNSEFSDQLIEEDLEWLQQFDRLLRQPWSWPAAGPPEWVPAFVSHVRSQVPHYRSYGESLPPLDKEVLRQSPWTLVPDDQDLERMYSYNTSGTTGTRMQIPWHARVSASYLPLLKWGLELYGIDWDDRPVAMVQVSYQKLTTTYAMYSQYLKAGFAKLNLFPDEWRSPDDRAIYLDDCRPVVITGNPLSFDELSRLPLKRVPRALVSSGMTLMPALRRRLEDHFGCPVLDMYSMTECLAIALKRDEAGGHRLISPDLWVELLNDEGCPVANGNRGEVTLTGGRNPYLPLVRYRTRDHAILEVRDGVGYLMNLEGRATVAFQARDGRRFNNIDVTHALALTPLVQFSLHQNADLSLRLNYRGEVVSRSQIEAALGPLFGDLPLEVERVQGIGEREKWVQYTSDLL